MQTFLLLLFFIYNPSVNNSVNTASLQYETDKTMYTEYSQLKHIQQGLREKMFSKIYQKKVKRAMPDLTEDQIKQLSALSMFLGIFSLAILFIPFPAVGLLCIPAAVLAIIFGLKVKKRDKQNKKATAGLILGIATLSLLIIAVLALISFFAIGLYNI